MTKESYALLDSGNGRKLEKFGQYTLVRPSAQALWQPRLSETVWQKADAVFDRVEGQRWHNRSRLPESWEIEIDGIRFRLSSTDFGHLGVFPEQRASWQWIRQTLQTARKAGRKSVNLLNIFAYSGGSTLAAALEGAQVCHLDASAGMVQWARENTALNNLAAAPIRWIVDDAHKFMKREIKRGRRYDAIVLDPPSFGRGAQGEVYKIERDLTETLDLCAALFSSDPLLLLLSAHTPGITPVILGHMLAQTVSGNNGKIITGEALLTGAPDVWPLPSGCFARWQRS